MDLKARRPDSSQSLPTPYTFLSRWVCMRADLDGKLWPRHGESNPDSQRACSLGEPSWRATPAKVGRDFSLVQS